MKITEINTLEQFLLYRGDYERLSHLCGQDNPFICFDKMCVSIAHIEKFRYNKVRIFIVKENDEVVAIFPFEERTAYKFLKIRYFLGNEFADYTDMPVKPGYEHCFSEFIKKYSSLCTIYILRCLPDQSRILSILGGCSGIFHLEKPQTVCPVAKLERYSGEIIDNVSKKTRYDINYNLRRLRRDGEPEFLEAKTPAEKLELIETLIKLHTDEWNSRGKRGLADQPRVCEYYRMMSEMFKDGDCSLSVTALKLNGEYVAIHMGFEDKNRLYYYKPAFNVKFAKYSPGKLLIYYNMLMCREKGIKIFDFLVGDESYKYNWFTDEAVVKTGFVSRKNPLSRFMIKIQIKRDMPTGIFPGLHAKNDNIPGGGRTND